MMTARELVKVAKSLELSFCDFERICDELMTLTFTPYYVSWASLQILEERFGDSLWNYGFYGNSECACKFVVTVKPSIFDF